MHLRSAVRAAPLSGATPVTGPAQNLIVGRRTLWQRTWSGQDEVLPFSLIHTRREGDVNHVPSRGGVVFVDEPQGPAPAPTENTCNKSKEDIRKPNSASSSKRGGGPGLNVKETTQQTGP